jgi:hypothetical protein
MGMGFYGRSFTMSDPTCSDPGCAFDGAGAEGLCSEEAGILTYAELVAKNYTLDRLRHHYDPETTVKYMQYSGNQWISYDDAESFAGKRKFLNSLCLSGLMIWAIDQDTQDLHALSGLLGEDAVADGLMHGGELSDEEKSDLSDVFAPFTGQNCYITPKCTNGVSSEKGEDQVCKGGYTSVEMVHLPMTNNYGIDIEMCEDEWYHHVCCPDDEIPQNCQWTNTPTESVSSLLYLVFICNR